jgi:hypothetical protein
MPNSKGLGWYDYDIGVQDEMAHMKDIRAVNPPGSLIYRHLTKRERLEACDKFINCLRNKGADYRGMVSIGRQRMSIWDIMLDKVWTKLGAYPLVGVTYANQFVGALLQERSAMTHEQVTTEYTREAVQQVRLDMAEWRMAMRDEPDQDAVAREFFARHFGVTLDPPPAPQPAKPQQQRMVASGVGVMYDPPKRPTYEQVVKYKALKDAGLME